MFVDYLSGIHERTFTFNGGRDTIKNYTLHGFNIGDYDYRKRIIPKDHIDFFSNLELYYETENFIFVHAGIHPGTELNRTSEEILLWDRGFVFSKYSGKPVIFGHTPSSKVMNEESQICIDTGACFRSMGDLTCVKLPERIFIRQGDTLGDLHE